MARERLAVDRDQAEGGGISERPLEIVQERPVQVAAHVNAFGAAVQHLAQSGIDVRDAFFVESELCRGRDPRFHQGQRSLQRDAVLFEKRADFDERRPRRTGDLKYAFDQRNGAAVEPGRAYRLLKDAVVTFGHADERWLLADAGEPQTMAVALDTGQALLGAGSESNG